MTVFGALYQLLIGPLELFFEAVYGFSRLFFSNPGISIVLMSLTMNVLLLPLYRRADAIQEEERSTAARLSRWIAHIKKTFTGDERYMMLQIYYRQNHYRPFYALRGSLPLMLEIPFFIAAYHFLSNLPELRGAVFGPIADLGSPDRLLTLGGVTVHLLPILMTLINAVSSAIYTKGLPLKDKLQLYGMALIFLVLLYESPSGLVLYWTLNNLFSLVKNLLGKLKDPKKVLRTALAVLGAALLGFSLFGFHPARWTYRLLLIAVALLMELPLLKAFLARKGRLPRLSLSEESSPKRFFGGALILTVLTGLLIPSAVIKASPAEFVQLADFYSPLRHVFNAFLLAAGLFVIWFGIFYYLAPKKGKALFELLLWILDGAALADYLFFGTDLGILSAELKYEIQPSFSLRARAVNLAVLLVLAALFLCLWKSAQKLVRTAAAVLILALCAMSVLNMVQIGSKARELEGVAQAADTEQASFTLSRNGRNVVVIMLDRAISSYLPYLMEEKPELKEQFAGFTYYPNTLSHGPSTLFGAPGLWGGYEYTPEAMNERPEESLKDKHDEALLVLPVLFDEAGYEVTVCDPPFAGYSWIPDLSIYDGYPQIRTFVTEQGQFSLDSEADRTEALNTVWKRNFFCYSLMKVSPLALQPSLYQGGSYFASDSFSRGTQTEYGLSEAQGTRKAFMDSYAVLEALPSVTKITDGAEEKNTALLLTNTATHEQMLLQEPDYQPAETVDNRAYDEAHADRFTLNGRTLRMADAYDMSHYHVNMAGLLSVGRWLDYLRENGVYDNTRIIIVSDHGWNMRQLEDLIFGTETYEDVMAYNPLLLVKDFGATEFTVDNSFMTNADTPALALEGLIPDAKNPFTGQPIDGGRKEEGPQRIYYSDKYDPIDHGGNTFDDGVWFQIDGDIFDLSRWKKLGAD